MLSVVGIGEREQRRSDILRFGCFVAVPTGFFGRHLFHPECERHGFFTSYATEGIVHLNPSVVQFEHIAFWLVDSQCGLDVGIGVKPEQHLVEEFVFEFERCHIFKLRSRLHSCGRIGLSPIRRAGRSCQDGSRSYGGRVHPFADLHNDCGIKFRLRISF